MSNKPDRLRATPPRRKLLGLPGNRFVAAAAVVVICLVPLALVLAFGGSGSWQEWLSRLSARDQASSDSSNKFGRRATGSPAMSYLGDGRAELGEYKVKVFDPLTRTTRRTEFRLEGRTACKDAAEFERFIQGNGRFFREQVAIAIRNFGQSDLEEPGFDLLEKKLVSRVNRALGRRFLQSVQIKDLSRYESSGRAAAARGKDTAAN